MYDWGLVREERQIQGEAERGKERRAPLYASTRTGAPAAATGTRGHGHARTQMNLRAARHAGTPSRVSKHTNSQASGHVNMQACQRDGLFLLTCAASMRACVSLRCVYV
jgi:hypothetical protein